MNFRGPGFANFWGCRDVHDVLRRPKMAVLPKTSLTTPGCSELQKLEEIVPGKMDHCFQHGMFSSGKGLDQPTSCSHESQGF